MLNISEKRIDEYIDRSKYPALQAVENRDVSNVLLKIIIGFSLLAVLSLFLPWTQNVRSNGSVTTLYPEERPQSIQSLIGGKIEKWYVREGDTIARGDTILIITESKQEYLDPQLIERYQDQIDVNNQAINVYDEKANQLDQQYDALKKNLEVKLNQNQLKIAQTKNKIVADSTALVAAKVVQLNTKKQLERTKSLYEKGIKSLTEFENKESDYNAYVAKVNEIENKIEILRNDLKNLSGETQAIAADYQNKLSKILSEQQSIVSEQLKTENDITKLKSDKMKMTVRSDNYVVRAPIDGLVTKTLRSGIGEIIKEGEKLATLVPLVYSIGVEVFVRPMDVPLLDIGQKVRIQFDGWPAIVFSGWPENSYGTFGGQIFAIDNDISENGMYRLLVAPDNGDQKWPELVRIGGGANALILLNDVRLYYELWRQLNGFPPDFYNDAKSKGAKTKAPIKKLK